MSFFQIAQFTYGNKCCIIHDVSGVLQIVHIYNHFLVRIYEDFLNEDCLGIQVDVDANSFNLVLKYS